MKIDLVTPDLVYELEPISYPDRITCSIAQINDDRLNQVCNKLGYTLLESTVYCFGPKQYKLFNDTVNESGTYIFVRLSGEGTLLAGDRVIPTGPGWYVVTCDHWAHRYTHFDGNESRWLIMLVKQ